MALLLLRRSAICLLLAAVPLAAGWIDVPFVEQRPNGCGAAVTAMVMQYWDAQGFGAAGEASKAAAIYDNLYSAEARGILGSHIEAYLREHGFRPYVFEGRWDELAWHIARGRPLIVCVRSDSRAPLHYLVVAGIDEQQGFILVNDPARRKLTRIDRDSFLQSWEASGYWTLLALPAQP